MTEGHAADRPTGVTTTPVPPAPSPAPDPPASRTGGRPGDGRPPRRAPRRAVRRGAGEPDPAIDLRAADDSDVGWQAPPGGDSNDERLRRDVPPHW